MFNTKTLIATAALATALVAPAAASAATVRYAHTPSGNITCKAQRQINWTLACSVKSSGVTLRIGNDGSAYESDYTPIVSRGRSMQYEHTYYVGPFRCNSYEDGLSCVDPRGTGTLWLSREESTFLT